MHIEADRFLALTAMLAGFVPTGPGEGPAGPQGDRVDEANEGQVDRVGEGGRAGAERGAIGMG